MKIAISGSGGLIGKSLSAHLRTANHSLVGISRRPLPGLDRAIIWNFEKQNLNAVELEGIQCVIHLAGEPIADSRWTATKKALIRDSRVNSTRLLANVLAGLQRPPSVFICASAVGFYGNRGTEILTESSAPGTGFLAEVCQAWEAAAEVARQRGIRTVHLRTGMVLSRHGGALAKMRLPFQWGLGGRLGSGNQFMSWISMDDLVHIIDRMIQDEAFSGPVNAVSPHPVTNLDFTATLASAFGKPALLPVPVKILRWMTGDMADEVLLASQRVMPAKLLQASGFTYRHPVLEQALRAVL